MLNQPKPTRMPSSQYEWWKPEDLVQERKRLLSLPPLGPEGKEVTAWRKRMVSCIDKLLAHHNRRR